MIDTYRKWVDVRGLTFEMRIALRHMYDFESNYLRSFPIMKEALCQFRRQLSSVLSWLSCITDDTGSVTDSVQLVAPRGIYSSFLPCETIPLGTPTWQVPLAEVYGMERVKEAVPVSEVKLAVVRRGSFMLREVQAELQYTIDLTRMEGREAELMGKVWQRWTELVAGRDIAELSSDLWSDEGSPGSVAEAAVTKVLRGGSGEREGGEGGVPIGEWLEGKKLNKEKRNGEDSNGEKPNGEKSNEGKPSGEKPNGETSDKDISVGGQLEGEKSNEEKPTGATSDKDMSDGEKLEVEKSSGEKMGEEKVSEEDENSGMAILNLLDK